jgi:hypothetical protein
MGIPGGSPKARRRISPAATLAIGLGLTFVGLFLVIVIFPVGPEALVTTLPVVGSGLLFLWLGGLLLGRGGRRPPSGVPR